MGERRKEALRVNFNRNLKLEFHGSRLTSDSGLLIYRELDDALDLTEMAGSKLIDLRTGKNTQHDLIGLLRQSIYSRLGGYEDTNDAERLSIDSAMRHLIGGKTKEQPAASTSQMGRFETEILTQTKNQELLLNMPGKWVDRIHPHKPPKMIILDMDSSDSPTHGNQEGSAYNGHFGYTCYHPLFCFNQFGDLERALLRNGNVYSSEVWEAVLKPVVERYSIYDILKFFRGDAAFALPGLYIYLEAEKYYYTIRLKGNDILYEKIEHLLTRPVGRPSHQPKVFYESFYYQANTWDKPRRVVAKVEWHAGELFPRVGFIVTNLTWKSKTVVKFYNKRGTAEQWIKEGKNAINWTRLSCHDFDDNQVRLQLFALAYNLGNFMRRLVLPRKIQQWTLTTLREKLVKIGARVVKHAGYYIFQMAEVFVNRLLFGKILDRIDRLRLLGFI